VYYAETSSGIAGINALGVTIDLTNCDDLLQRAQKNAQLLQTHPNNATYKKNGQLRYNQYAQCVQTRGQQPQPLAPFTSPILPNLADPSVLPTGSVAPVKKAKKPGILDSLINAITPAGNAPYTQSDPADSSGGGSLIPGGVFGIGALVVAGGAVIYFMTRKSRGPRVVYRSIGRSARRAARRVRRTYRKARSSRRGR
jgi:hypothetical protein